MKHDPQKKAIILQHGGGELANQLWNYLSVYAYALETKRKCLNYSFFEYNSFFNLSAGNKIIELLFFKPFAGRTERRNGILTRFLRNIYKMYVLVTRICCGQKIISSKNSENKPFYLPPTENTENGLLNSAEETLYFDGWLFRNPIGMEKYRKEILEHFKPIDTIEKNTAETISEIRKKYKNIIGVHVRQGDYKEFKGGKYFIEQKRIREIINEYLKFFEKEPEKTYFIFTSDGKIEKDIFEGLNFEISGRNAVTDLFLLSKTDTIIGSDSSFGDFAAYYGNIPHIIFKNETIDWKYYEGKNKFFQNKYCTMTNY